MNSNKIIQAAAVFIGLMVAMLLALSAFSDTKVLGNVYKYIMIGGALVGVLAPRLALVILLICSGYLDFFKRLLAVEGGVSFLDVIIILAFPPLCVSAAFVACTYQGIALRKDWRPGLGTLWFISVIVMGALAAGTLLSFGLSAGGLRTLANAASYAALIYVIPYLYRTKEDVMKTVRWLILLSIPIAIYGLIQKYQGFSDFEIAYLNTGLSGEIRILYGQDYRVFSTLNSSQNLCKVMALMGALALIPLKEGTISKWLVSFWWRLPLVGLFFYTAFQSGSRTGLVMGAIVIFLFLLYKSRILTVAFYAFGLVAVTALIIMAPRMYESGTLAKWQGSLGEVIDVGSDTEARAIQLVTLNARLRSMSLLHKPEYWTPFGAGLAKKKYLFEQEKIHDVVTQSVVRFGYIPCFLGGIMLLIMLWKSHRFIWRQPRGSSEKKIAMLSMAVAISTIIGGLSATANLETYPISYYLYLFIGFGVFMRVCRLAEAEESRKEAVAERRKETAPRPRVSFGTPATA